jgi:hypothetical protein
MQLVGVGEQNGFITGPTPEITFWKSDHRTHTNFATQSMELQFNGQVGFGKTMTCPIPRNGDLISDLVLCFDVPGVKVSDDYIAAFATNETHTRTYHGDVQQAGDCSAGTGNSAYDIAMNPYSVTHQSTLFGQKSGLGLSDASQNARIDSAAAQDAWATWVDSLGHAIIESVQITVGGQPVDTHTGEWLQLWEEFAGRPGARLREAIGRFDNLPQLINFWNSESRKLYVPLRFWFCGVAGLAFPFIGLHHHDIKVELKTNALSKLIMTSDPAYSSRMYQRVDGAGAVTSADLNVTLFCEYVYLEGAERRRFANMDHEYMFHQVQRLTDIPINGNPSSSIGLKHMQKLELNHPVVALFLTVQQVFVAERNRSFNYAGDGGEDPIDKVRFTLNSQDRLSEREARWCRLVEPARYGANVPQMFAYMISFGLNPLNPIQPSGAVNFSKIENAVLHLVLQKGLADATLSVYAYGWNIFRVKNGMGGPVYAS